MKNRRAFSDKPWSQLSRDGPKPRAPKRTTWRDLKAKQEGGLTLRATKEKIPTMKHAVFESLEKENYFAGQVEEDANETGVVGESEDTGVEVPPGSFVVTRRFVFTSSLVDS